MRKEILLKLKELYDLILNEKITDSECVIVGDHSDEANLIGNEDAYFKLIYSISKMLLFSNGFVTDCSECEIVDQDLLSVDIKYRISEYSDFWIVGMLLQDLERFKKTSDDQYQKWKEVKSW